MTVVAGIASFAIALFLSYQIFPDPGSGDMGYAGGRFIFTVAATTIVSVVASRVGKSHREAEEEREAEQGRQRQRDQQEEQRRRARRELERETQRLREDEEREAQRLRAEKEREAQRLRAEEERKEQVRREVERREAERREAELKREAVRREAELLSEIERLREAEHRDEAERDSTSAVAADRRSMKPEFGAPTDFIAIAAGGPVGMALRANGTVVAWGAFGGDVGSMSGPDGRAFVPEGLVGVKAIATSGDHCLAVKEDGTVVAWGVDERSRLAVPRGLIGVKAVAAGYSHSLALKMDGTVVAWGDNSAGGCNVPNGLTDVVSVAIVGTRDHSLAIRRDGTPVAWGGWGEKLEGGDSATDVLSMDGSVVLRRDGTVVETDGTPLPSTWAGSDKVEVTGDSSDIAAIAGPFSMHADGTVSYRGDHEYGDEMGVPQDLAGVRAIAAGRSFALALKQDGTLVAWGSNSGGQLDVPSADISAQCVLAPRTYPTPASDSERPRRFVAVAAGWQHSVALRNDGTVAAWGSNSRGQLDVPENLTGAVQIAAGATHTIALLSDGTVVTWGRTVGGPIDQPVGLSDVIAVAAGRNKNLALTNDGTLILWEQSFSRTEGLPNDWADVTAAALGDEPVALRRDGRVLVRERPWGSKTAPAGLEDVASVAVSCSTPYALQRNGAVVSWVEAFDPLKEFSYANGQAVRFPNPTNVVSMAAGWRHALAISTGGSVIAWGDNSDGQATVPSGLDNVIDVAAGEAHSLALDSDGRIIAWGLNRDGQLNAPTPESASVDSDASRVVLGLAFRAKENRTGTRFWKFRLEQAEAPESTWIAGYRDGDPVFENDPLFTGISDSYYSMMVFRVMEHFFQSFKWEGDFSQSTKDLEDEEFPILVRGKISVRQQDLSVFLTDQANNYGH